MPTGKVMSFSAEKGFGFIASSDDSYFFHASDLPSNAPANSVKRGDAFQFDDVPGPKGMKAKRLVKIQQVTSMTLHQGDMIINREPQPKYGEVLFGLDVCSPYHNDPNVCRQTLINAARSAGCNALLGFQVTKETWNSGNYHYSMHTAIGKLCLVGEQKPCQPHELAAKKNELTARTDQCRIACHAIRNEFNRRRYWQTFPWGLVIGLPIFIVIGLIIFSLMG